MAHPAACFFINAAENAFMVFYVELCKTIFTLFGLVDFSSKGIDHKMHAVTDAEYWNFQIKNSAIDFRAVFIINT